MKKTKKILALMLLFLMLFIVNSYAVENNREPEIEVTPYWFTPGVNHEGYIYTAKKHKKSNWSHGHSGIGGRGRETIEAYSDTGVAVFADGYNRNWRNIANDGGIYKVKGATSSQYIQAMNYAYRQVGKPYSLNLFDGEKAFYCSELVYKAWLDAGIKVGTNIAGLVTPTSIANHANTIRALKF